MVKTFICVLPEHQNIFLKIYEVFFQCVKSFKDISSIIKTRLEIIYLFLVPHLGICYYHSSSVCGGAIQNADFENSVVAIKYKRALIQDVIQNEAPHTFISILCSIHFSFR